jgi:hypothetical protein
LFFFLKELLALQSPGMELGKAELDLELQRVFPWGYW